MVQGNNDRIQNKKEWIDRLIIKKKLNCVGLTSPFNKQIISVTDLNKNKQKKLALMDIKPKTRIRRMKFIQIRGVRLTLLTKERRKELTIEVRFKPPFSFFRKTIFGGVLFSLIPKPSNSFSIKRLCCSGFRTSRTMKIRPHVLATVNKRSQIEYQNSLIDLKHTI